MDNRAKGDDRPAVLAVASFGGHLVQLMRTLHPLRESCRIVYVSTAEEARPTDGSTFYTVRDFSRTDAWRSPAQLLRLHRIIRQERPAMVISTGAAPGLMAVIVARLMGIRTLWIDSVANADHLSLCGRIAARISSRTLTQWPHLANSRVEYKGNVL